MHLATLSTQLSPSTIHSPAADWKHVLDYYWAHVSLIATHTLLISSNVQVLSQSLQLENELESDALPHDLTYLTQLPPSLTQSPSLADDGHSTP